jgi:hypothetical protein
MRNTYGRKYCMNSRDASVYLSASSTFAASPLCRLVAPPFRFLYALLLRRPAPERVQETPLERMRSWSLDRPSNLDSFPQTVAHDGSRRVMAIWGSVDLSVNMICMNELQHLGRILFVRPSLLVSKFVKDDLRNGFC